MQCWCARCKALVTMVHVERWITSERGESIVRGACATCGAAIGEIGIYVPPRAQRQSEPSLLEQVPVA